MNTIKNKTNTKIIVTKHENWKQKQWLTASLLTLMCIGSNYIMHVIWKMYYFRNIIFTLI